MNLEQAIAQSAAQGRLAKILRPVKVILLVLCAVLLALLIWLIVSSAPLASLVAGGVFASLCGLLAWMSGRYRQQACARVIKLDAIIETQRAANKAHNLDRAKHSIRRAPGKIALSVGFANLAGDSMASILAEDIQTLSALFSRSVVPPAGKIPTAEVLFVYARLKEDGTLSPSGKAGIRQIVQLTNARIVVLASPNSAQSIQQAIALPGPKTANMVFTLSRNDEEFGRFFRRLFKKMQGGKDMLGAWAELMPQRPDSPPSNAPVTMLVAEAGKVAFPH